MIGRVVHLIRKDLGEHRAWLAAFLGLVAVRATLVGSGIDARISDQNLLTALSLAAFLLTILDGALLVALAVQFVQGDRLVGTTAFWLTRPVRRSDLVVAKIGTAVAVLVLVPILFDALAMIVNGLSWRHAAGAMVEGAALRLAIVLPAMALASVTADLAGFVVSAVGALFTTVALEAAFQWGWKAAPRTSGAAYAATAVFIVVLIVGATAAFAHQVLTRRRARSAGVMAAAGLIAIVAANRWTVDFISTAKGLEPGWLDPSRVTMTLTPAGADLTPGTPGTQQWLVQASYAVAGAPPGVALVPVGLKSAAVFADGTRETLDSGGPDVPWRAFWQSYALGMAPVGAILGGVRVIGTPEVPAAERLRTLGWLAGDRYRQYVDGRVRFEVDATLGAVGYRVGAVLALDDRATGVAGIGRFSILSAACEAGKCTVVVRDVMPASLLEYGRLSRMAYVLANKSRGLALLNEEQDYRSRVQVFGSTPILTEHVLVVHHRLVFEAQDDAPGLADAGWQQEAAIAAVEMRDIGTFRVRTEVSSRQQAAGRLP
jgi:hypothetical protein